MRQPIIAGNWKMNGRMATVTALLDALKSGAGQVTKVAWVVFPPALYIERTARLLAGSPIAWGGQNIHPADQGAYTGELSVSMLRDLDCDFVLIGHSERRHLFGETDAFVAEKFSAAAGAGLTPIVCVGETRAERDAGQTEVVLSRQIKALCDSSAGVAALDHAVIAYEPVWAIGTGLSATPDQAQAAHRFIRAQIAEQDAEVAAELRILYGGSVTPENAEGLATLPDVDGMLVGGASLDAAAFLGIGKICSHCY